MALNICMLAGMYYAVHFCANLPRQKIKSIHGRRDTGRNKAQEGQRTIARGQESSTSTPVPQRHPHNLSTASVEHPGAVSRSEMPIAQTLLAAGAWARASERPRVRATGAASKPQNHTTPRAQGAGDYEVLWHDGKLHDRQFNVREAADAFYNTINPDFAHRLSYKGVELKAHIWGPWPAEWIPAPSSPTRGAGGNATNVQHLTSSVAARHSVGLRGDSHVDEKPVEVESRHENGVWAIGHVPNDTKIPAPDHMQKLRLLVLKNDFHVDIKKAGAGASICGLHTDNKPKQDNASGARICWLPAIVPACDHRLR